MKRDHYEVLEVDRQASAQEIKKAYRKMAIRYHPDKNRGDKRAEEKFKEAAEAYSVLADPDKRARYDRFGHAGLGQGRGGVNPDIFADFSDILGDFFGLGDLFGRRGSRRGGAARGADLRYDLNISFEESAVGVKTKIKIPRLRTCGGCSGSGADPKEGLRTCPGCRGRGQVAYQQGFFTISSTCSQCRGRGQTILKPCQECGGTGRLQEEKTLELRIPAGVSEETRMRVSGEGESGEGGGPPGDLFVVIHVDEHPFFKRQADDVICQVPITFPQAALGGEVTVKTLDGDERIRIPAGTQTGTVFRLRSKGFPDLNGGARGDQLVRATVVTPTKLDSEQREIYEKLAEISGVEHSEGTWFDRFRDFFS